VKSESIKILIGEIDYKLGRVDYFKTHLKEWENKEEEDYKKSQRRLAKLIDETKNLLQIMKLEELDKFKEYQEIYENLEISSSS
jgi:tRNA(Ile)-lysidine synthase TilS/MesJ